MLRITAVLVCLTLLPLGGCGKDGPVPIGPDTYMDSGTSGSLWGSAGDIQESLYRDAAAFCASQGRQMVGLYQDGNNAAPYVYAHATIQFRCLKAGDPQLTRPNFRPVPQVGIAVEGNR